MWECLHVRDALLHLVLYANNFDIVMTKGVSRVTLVAFGSIRVEAKKYISELDPIKISGLIWSGLFRLRSARIWVKREKSLPSSHKLTDFYFECKWIKSTVNGIFKLCYKNVIEDVFFWLMCFNNLTREKQDVTSFWDNLLSYRKQT